MQNQQLKFLAQAVIQEQAQKLLKQEQILIQKENYFQINVLQNSDIASKKQEIEKLVIEYQQLLILKYMQEAIKQVQCRLDQIFFHCSFENYPDDLKCYISTIKYLSSFITNIPSFPKFMEEFNNCFQNQQSIDFNKTVAKRAYKIMKFQKLLGYYMGIFKKQKGIDLNIYFNLQIYNKKQKDYGRIKFAFKKQLQSFQSKCDSQCSQPISSINSYSITPQPKIVGYYHDNEQQQNLSSIDQQQNCRSMIPPFPPQMNNINNPQQTSQPYNSQNSNELLYGQSAIQFTGNNNNTSNFNYPPMPQSYYGYQTKQYQYPQQQNQQNLFFQTVPCQQQNYSLIQQQQVQQYSYQQNQQQQYFKDQIKCQQYQNQNSFQQQFNQYQQPQTQQQVIQNMLSFQENPIQQQVMTDSIFQKSQSEISENQNNSVQQFCFDASVQPENMLLDDASFQEQINLKEDVSKLQIQQQQSEFEGLVINKSKITQILLDPLTNKQVLSKKQLSQIGDKSNQHDTVSLTLLDKFLERKLGQFDRDDKKKQILQLFDF
ncbi:unnamed protein product [Paramecium sonneborni]|uniref:Uncharacterized protein n=1 Tax=Paramecium sonneborni TaxID=65129 RepID=A0A8S1KN15_9CILI|nr:unnamed protein product [Paramecium sonneborni]